MPPSTDAVITDVLTLKPEQTVREAMDIFTERNIRSLPVIDNDGKFVGMFGLRHILLDLLPKSVSMQDGLENLDFIQGSTPGVAKRLRKLYPQLVSEHMEKEPITIDESTALWEAVRIMAKYGSPIALIEQESNKFVGLISRQTLLRRLEREIEELEKTENSED